MPAHAGPHGGGGGGGWGCGRVGDGGFLACSTQDDQPSHAPALNIHLCDQQKCDTPALRPRLQIACALSQLQDGNRWYGREIEAVAALVLQTEHSVCVCVCHPSCSRQRLVLLGEHHVVQKLVLCNPGSGGVLPAQSTALTAPAAQHQHS